MALLMLTTYCAAMLYLYLYYQVYITKIMFTYVNLEPGI